MLQRTLAPSFFLLSSSFFFLPFLYLAYLHMIDQSKMSLLLSLLLLLWCAQVCSGVRWCAQVCAGVRFRKASPAFQSRDAVRGSALVRGFEPGRFTSFRFRAFFARRSPSLPSLVAIDRADIVVRIAVLNGTEAARFGVVLVGQFHPPRPDHQVADRRHRITKWAGGPPEHQVALASPRRITTRLRGDRNTTWTDFTSVIRPVRNYTPRTPSRPPEVYSPPHSHQSPPPANLKPPPLEIGSD